MAKAGAAPGNSLPQAFCRPFQSNCRSYTPQPSVFHGVEALFARRQTLQTLPSNPSAGLSTATLAATRPSHLFLRPFKTAVCPPSNPSNPPAGLSKATLVKGFKRAAAAPTTKPSRRPFQGDSRSYTPQPMLQTSSNPSAGLSKATLAATRPSHLFLRAFQPAVCASHLSLRAFKPAVCLPSNPSKPPAGLPHGLSKATVAATRPSHLFHTALKLCLPAAKRFKRFLQTLPQAFPQQLSQLLLIVFSWLLLSSNFSRQVYLCQGNAD